MIDFGDCPVTPPFVTFDERLNVYVDDLKIELIFVGPAHTTNDIVAWIPDRKLLFTGDIVFNGGTPFALGGLRGRLARCARHHRRARRRDHRPRPRRRLRPGGVRTPCATTCASSRRRPPRARRLASRRSTLARDLDLGPFATLHDPERLVPNLHRAYAELRGERRGAPLDSRQMFGEMLAYNGGKPLRCLA